MPLKKPFLALRVIVLTAFSLGLLSTASAASRLLPNVTPGMEDPQFWIKRVQNPKRVILTPTEIRKMNEETLLKEGLYLCRVKDLKEDRAREELAALLDEDWQGFGKNGGIRYGRHGVPLGDLFWDGLKANLNIESINERNRVAFALVVRRTDVRVFPTEELSMSAPENDAFDRFQHSSVSPGSLVGIYLWSRDRIWAYVQTGYIRGWVHATDLAVAKEKRDAVGYEERSDRLMITGSFVRVFGDPSFQRTVFVAQMGASYPILRDQGNDRSYAIQIPCRENDGSLAIRTGYIPGTGDVHPGCLPYTQEHLARQAFKMLHQPYGWGEMFGSRDCSRFIMDIFATFGILMPRNSKLQARIGISLGEVEDREIGEKKKVLDRAVPFATLLRLPGHIMLYLGKHQESYYVIHSIWAVQKRGWFAPALEKIGRVAVSDLSLGKSGPVRSLLHRLTDIQFIGPASELR